MQGVAQFGIAIGALGIVLAVMGLFPGITGIRPGAGVGLVQFATILAGFILIDLGALIYVKFTLYVGRPANLIQQIGVRLSLTGLILSGMAGVADFLGFGSHPRTPEMDGLFGPLQTIGLVGGLTIAALGVLIYAAAGSAPEPDH
ncbi:MAG: hypothetical protein NZM00_12920, partial [Anaerolinea sp.]|nr:hypothetical protein [Anaerolinea sp.]